MVIPSRSTLAFRQSFSWTYIYGPSLLHVFRTPSRNCAQKRKKTFTACASSNTSSLLIPTLVCLSLLPCFLQVLYVYFYVSSLYFVVTSTVHPEPHSFVKLCLQQHRSHFVLCHRPVYQYKCNYPVSITAPSPFPRYSALRGTKMHILIA